jgi:hypothetical protein
MMGAVDLSLSDVATREGRRALAVRRRLRRHPEGVTTRGFHRRRRVQHVAFPLLSLVAVALVALLVTAG